MPVEFAPKKSGRKIFEFTLAIRIFGKLRLNVYEFWEVIDNSPPGL